MKQQILITGGAGNVASALAFKLSTNDQYEIIIFDNLSTGSIEKVPVGDNIVFIKGDVNKIEDLLPVFDQYIFTYVFHYAAMVGVQRTLMNPLMVLNDIEGIKNILLLSKKSGVKRVFYSSSSEVYGEPFEIPQNEKTTPLNSRLPYAIVKNVGEAFFKSYQQEFGLDYTIFRFFNTYGPNQSEDFVISKFLKSAISHEPICIYGDGSQTRSFCYVDDNVDSCINAMTSDLSRNDVINIGSDKEQTILSLAQSIIRITNSKSKIVHLPPLVEGDMTRRCPDIYKMRKLLNRELITIEEGIKMMLRIKNEKPLY